MTNLNSNEPAELKHISGGSAVFAVEGIPLSKVQLNVAPGR
jgi:hypothetical protein